MAYLWVAIGGALGSIARYFFSGALSDILGGVFPSGTLFVNVTGAAIIGFFAALSLPEGRLVIPPPTRLLVMTGFCGGYTTFSTFSLETLNLMRDGEWSSAAANVLISVAICLIAVWSGLILGLKLSSRG